MDTEFYELLLVHLSVANGGDRDIKSLNKVEHDRHKLCLMEMRFTTVGIYSQLHQRPSPQYLKYNTMYLNRAVRIFPCLMCWTPEVKCPNYVFLKRSICVDCERMRRQYGENEQIASHVHETFVRYLLDKYSERDGITYEKINAYIKSAKEVNVDNLLTVALDYIFRNFSELYHAVCDAVEIARDRGPIQWTPDNLAERLERVRAEQEWDQKGRYLDGR